MSDRPGWRVENGRWVLGGTVFAYLRVYPDGMLEMEDDCYRLDRAEAGVLGRLLLAFEETGVVPMDGAVPQSEGDRLPKPVIVSTFDGEPLFHLLQDCPAIRAAKWLIANGWRIETGGWKHGRGRYWQVTAPGRRRVSPVFDAELIEFAKNAGWTE